MASTINAKSTGAGGLDYTGDSSGVLGLQTGGVTAVTVDASQNVGIGRTSGGYKLEVNDTSLLSVNQGSTTGSVSTALALDSKTSGAFAAGQGSALNFQITNSAGAQAGCKIASINNADNNTAYLAFYPRNYGYTEAMRIDSSGNVLVGMSGIAATGSKFDVAQQTDTATTVGFFDARQATASNQYGIFARLNGDPNNTTNYFFSCNGAATQRATIRSNGGLANYQANNVNLSDAREKTNIELAGNYLDKICVIPVKTFNYIDQNMEDDPGLTLGVIAQDVQEVAPELISESNWAGKDEPEKLRLSIYQTDLQYALMKSIQELKAIVDAQQQEINALKAK